MRTAVRINWGLRVLGTITLTSMISTTVLADDSPKPQPGSPPMKKIEDFAPPEEFVIAGGVKTHFIARGKGGPPVVLVHGFGSSTFSWSANIDALAKSHRVYALDLKGFGLTAKPKDGVYHLKEYTRHLIAFLDEMKLETVVLVGHSMGGGVVTRLALLNPERVSALVLIDTAPAGDLGPLLPLKKDELAGMLLNSALSTQILSSLLKSLISKERMEAGLRGSFRDPSKVTPEMLERLYIPFTIEGAPKHCGDGQGHGPGRNETATDLVSWDARFARLGTA